MNTPKIPPIDPDDLSHQADPERVARIWARLEPEVTAMAGRRSRGDRWSDRVRPRGTTWLVAAALGGVLGAGIWIGRSSAPRTNKEDGLVPIASTMDVTLDVFASGSTSRTFALPNGGSLMLDPESTVEVAELSESQMVLRLLRGTASVDGTHLVGGSVSIVAGEARMTAPAGGSMAVRRNASDVDVIAMGRPVEVESPLGHRTVASGERLHAVPTHTTTAHVLAPAPRTPTGPTDPDVPTAPTAHGPLALARDPEATDPAIEPPTGKEVKPAEEPASDWLVKYQANDWRGAYQALGEAGGAAAAIDRARGASELGTLCDVMRLNAKSDLAIRAAKRIIDEFPGDPLAQPFAITLANLYDRAGRGDLAQEVLLRVGKSQLQEDVACRQMREGSPTDPAIIALAQQYVAKFGASASGPSAFPPQCMDLAEPIVADAAAAKAAETPADPKSAPPPEASATPSSSAPAAPSSSAAPSSKPAAPPASAAPSTNPSTKPAPTPPKPQN
jgi:hypothetical protein